MKTRSNLAVVLFGVLMLAVSLAACKGDAGDPGPAGPPGADGTDGTDGATGPSATTQVLRDPNLALSTTCATPTVITTVTLSGPATYLVTASGFQFSSGGTQVSSYIDLYRDAVRLAHGEFGAIINATGHVETSYAFSRLMNITAGGQTVQVRGCRFAGDGTPTVFTNSLNATLVGSGTGPQLLGGVGPVGPQRGQ